MGLFDFLRTSSKGSEENRRLGAQVNALRASSPFFQEASPVDLAQAVLEEVSERKGESLGMQIGVPVYRLLRELLQAEPFASARHCVTADGPLSAQVGERNALRTAIRHLSDPDTYLTKWASVSGSVLGGLFDEFPPQAFVDPGIDGSFEESHAIRPTAPLYSFVRDVPQMIHRIIVSMHGYGVIEDDLFAAVRETLELRLCLASGIDPDERHTTKKKFVFPGEKKSLADEELLQLYLLGTPFYPLLTTQIALPIPDAVRFEHTHIVAGTGHGKTQALQYLIAADLARFTEERSSIVVMDGQGDLIDTLLHSPFFAEARVAGSLIYIDPTDVVRPVGLNLFDIGNGALDAAPQVERETILNATIELYEYFFGSLLGADLTQRQELIFRYLATLMTKIPGANIHTLRELMENGDPFRKYIAMLDGSSRAFFETRFFDRSFNETRKQILNRLWGVLSNRSIERMMSSRTNSVDLFASLQAGSIVFINTARDFFGHEGSVIFSRMFVALLGQALMRRATVPRHERTPTYIYIDEAEAVVDLTLTRMLAQVRKYKGAITFAHQNLDQLPSDIRAGVIANTSIKLAGGLSAKDAQSLAGDFRVEPGFLLGQRKERAVTHFACYAKNVTDKAVTVSIPLGYLESAGRLDDSLVKRNLERSRTLYGVPEEAPAPTADAQKVKQSAEPPEVMAMSASHATSEPPAEAPGTPASSAEESDFVEQSPAIVITRAPPKEVERSPLPGAHGGVKHQALEKLVKDLAEERGFRVSVEEIIHGGAGRVDVVLTREELSIAVEISVTTTRDHELANVEKCLALPYARVVMLTSHERRKVSLERYISAALDEKERPRVSFLLPEEVPAFLDTFERVAPPKERTVKGYTVRSRVKEASAAESAARRKAVAKVVANCAQQ